MSKYRFPIGAILIDVDEIFTRLLTPNDIDISIHVWSVAVVFTTWRFDIIFCFTETL